MDFWPIAGNIVASLIVGVAVFAFGRSRGWRAKAKAKREPRAAGASYCVEMARDSIAWLDTGLARLCG